MREARTEAANIMSKLLVHGALSRNVSLSARFQMKPGDSLHLSSEQTKLWNHGLTVLSITHKPSGAKDGAPVVPLPQSNVLSNHPPSDSFTDIQQLLYNQRPEHTNTHLTVFQNEVLATSDPRAPTSSIGQAKSKQNAGLLARHVFNIVRKKIPSLPRGQLHGGRFVSAIKHMCKKGELDTALFVAKYIHMPKRTC